MHVSSHFAFRPQNRFHLGSVLHRKRKHSRLSLQSHWPNISIRMPGDVQTLPLSNDQQTFSELNSDQINKLLLLPDAFVFCRYSNVFQNADIETHYQNFALEHWFSRARWHIFIWIQLHLILIILITTLPSCVLFGMDQFLFSRDSASMYLQWTYLLLAVPFALPFLEIKTFRKRWRMWICCIIVMFHGGFQPFLMIANYNAFNLYQHRMEQYLHCGQPPGEKWNWTDPKFEIRLEDEMNVSRRLEFTALKDRQSHIVPFMSTPEPDKAQSERIQFDGTPSHDQDWIVPAFPHISRQRKILAYNTKVDYGNIVQLSIGVVSTITSIFAISIRLEFMQVTVVVVFSVLIHVICYQVIEYEYHFRAGILLAFSIGLLLCFSYYSDRINRRSFLANLRVDWENALLKQSLHKATAALEHGSACEEEIQVVGHVFALQDTEGRTCDSEKSSSQARQRLEAMHIPFASLEFLHAIGRGAIGDVIKTRYFGSTVVCKRLRRDQISETNIRHFRNEIELMSCLRHPNIVQFIGASWDNPSNICIVMEFMENGDLHTVLHSNMGRNFTWSDPLLNVALDIVHGMLYLHTREPAIIHRDLKSVNVFCSATFGCKVGDFGLSRRFNGDIDALTTLVGTPFWLAPEIIRNEPYGASADVYSFGIVLTELETRRTPYSDQEQTGLKLLLRIAHESFRPTLTKDPASDRFVVSPIQPVLSYTVCHGARLQLIRDCLDDDPQKRPTFADILTRLQTDVHKDIRREADQAAEGPRAILRRRETRTNSCENTAFPQHVQIEYTAQDQARAMKIRRKRIVNGYGDNAGAEDDEDLL